MKENNRRARDLETIIVLSVVFLIIFIISGREFFIFTGLALLIISLLLKRLTARISDLWLRLSELIGNFNSKIILTLVFFIVLTPVAVLYRVFSRNPLGLKRQEDESSYFCTRDHFYKREDFEKTW